ncbi:hypothetical protein PHYPSEUDO_004615 [Phytophthora pseudosyringae]|uniref:Uncharacterized protein n=1 Tax=Phytophthora pseudosyringae TaxID=221518 RepID=A0A8T1WE95_9STRA|nr:hypothetical protein PHYPSEUDO_004615 [Phytophthora pseudosyringae]
MLPLASFMVLETMTIVAKLTNDKILNRAVQARWNDVVVATGLATSRHTLVGDIFRTGLSGDQKRRLKHRHRAALEPERPNPGQAHERPQLERHGQRHEVHRETLRRGQDRRVHDPPGLRHVQERDGPLSGQSVYCGRRRQMMPHFASAGHDCPKYMNPAEYLIRLVNTDVDEHVDVPMLVLSYALGELCQELSNRIDTDRKKLQHLPEIEQPSPSALRNLLVPIVQVPLSELLGGHYVPEHDDDLTEEDLVLLPFYLPAFLVFMSVSVLSFFIEQLAVFARERANSSLSVVSYVCPTSWRRCPTSS